ncbi:GNAT family N-acetyltransferase [Streptomyces collinus]|uniref:Acetyltransferase n=1 Tax=Streptomyces collinus (strain DSM 40733 / Tue 365) TaxID=1214242 RepID=S5VIU6_STRC3|nr:GNAT family N-acetyltransferase [Streptomyces collinus]AGS70452.1 acetyltransferase [Streptomyces collinus Tu 365]UJA09095.1 GNAT family N-acetyltransferase [Streptomyces collinus]UJA16041.1 GNAT family N-acetyltransferase [Streptomyces collinus]
MNIPTGEDHVVRPIRPDEWAAMKQLRLDALRDPAAPMAFLETYEDAVDRPDSFYRERAERSAEEPSGARQFIAEAPDGTWAGSVTVLIEEPGTQDWAGHPVERRQGHVVGVYVRPEQRGTGLVKALFDAGVTWAWERGAERVRLLVHEANARAQGAYRKAGFVPSGVSVCFVKDESEKELEFVLERRP